MQHLALGRPGGSLLQGRREPLPAVADDSHCVAAGSGMPRLPWSLSRRLKGSPLPYFSNAIMLGRFGVVLLGADSGGAWAR